MSTGSISSSSADATAQSITGIPLVKIVGDRGKTMSSGELVKKVLPELRLALSRYRTLILSDSENVDYTLLIASSGGQRLSMELRDDTSSLIYAQSFGKTEHSSPMTQIAQRAAASIASPGVGAIDRQSLESSRLKPIESLTLAECFAHG